MNDGTEAVGSLSEEAARLAEALQGWAHSHGWAVGESADRVAVDSPECQLCPVCRLIARLRDSGPEVSVHLADAATSLLRAFHAFAGQATTTTDQAPRSGVQHIDIDEEAGWD